MKWVSVIILIIILEFFSSFAQQWPAKFDKDYDSDDIIETSDSGIAFVANNDYLPTSLFYKLDVNGNILWKKKFGTGSDLDGAYLFSLCQTADNGYLLGGWAFPADTNGDPVIIKLDACGELEWSHIYHIYHGNWAAYIKPLNDSSYLVICPNWVNDSSENSSIILVINDKGDLVRFAGFPSIFRHITTHGTNILLSGEEYIPSPDYPTAAGIRIVAEEVSADLHPGWKMNYSAEKNILGQSGYAFPLKSGEFFTIASNRSVRKGSTHAPCILMLNSKGEVEWTKLIGDTSQNEPLHYAIRESDTSFVAATAASIFLRNPPDYLFKLIRVNQYGDILKTKIFPKDPNYVFDIQKIVKNYENGYYLVGYWNNRYINDLHPGVYKVDKNLELVAKWNPDMMHYDAACDHKIQYSLIRLENSKVTQVSVSQTPGADLSISVFPNPFTSNQPITLTFNKPLPEGKYYFELYSMTGILLERQEAEIPFNHLSANFTTAQLLSPGVYIFRLRGISNNVSFTTRLLNDGK